MRKEDLWLKKLMVMLRKEGVYNARLCCAPCEVNVSILYIVYGIHTHSWSKSLSKMLFSPAHHPLAFIAPNKCYA